MEQLPLPVKLKSTQTFNSFVVGENAALVKSAQLRIQSSGQSVFWVWSVGGAGRSHLLQALCHEATAKNRRSVFLSMTGGMLQPALLEGLDQLDLVCLDDIDAIFPSPEWEQALFRLHLGVMERGANLVVSAAAPPAGLTIGLKDLESRFYAAEIWQLHPLAELDQVEALSMRASQLGLSLSQEVKTYLLRHAPRDLVFLCELLDELDTQTLVKQQGITVPLVRELLKRL